MAGPHRREGSGKPGCRPDAAIIRSLSIFARIGTYSVSMRPRRSSWVLLFGILPAVRSIRAAALNERSSSTQVFHARSGKMLIAFQVTLTMMLVFGAGLFLRTLVNLQTVPLGYQPDGLYRAEIQFRVEPTRAQSRRFTLNCSTKCLERRAYSPQRFASRSPEAGPMTWPFLRTPRREWRSIATRHPPDSSAQWGSECLPAATFRPGISAVLTGSPSLTKRWPCNISAIAIRSASSSTSRDETPSQIVGMVADTRVRGLRNEFQLLLNGTVARHGHSGV